MKFQIDSGIFTKINHISDNMYIANNIPIIDTAKVSAMFCII